MTEKLFSEIKFSDGVYIKDMLPAYKDASNGDWRVYVNPRHNLVGLKGGFEAICIFYYSSNSSCKNVWSGDNLYVTVALHAIAYYDGIRHLYFYPDEIEENNTSGYVNYPNVQKHAKILRLLYKFEKKYCEPDFIGKY